MIKRVLSTELRVWHLVAVVVLVLASGSGAMAGSAPPATPAPANPESYLAAGRFRMATSSSTTPLFVKSVDDWKEVLRASFRVPSGQKAGIAAFFNAEAYKYASGYCYARFELEDGTVFSPNNNGIWVADGYVYNGAYPTISVQGFRLAVPAGSHSVIVKIQATGGDCYLTDRSLILIANQY